VSRFVPALLAVAGVVVLPAAAAQAACPVERRAELRLTVLRNFLLVPVSIDGAAAALVVDTGAEATTVTPETVTGLGLAWTPSRTMMLGVGGEVRSGGTVRLHRLDLGELQLANRSLDVGALPPVPGTNRPVAGLLGLDVLGGYDIALDLPRHRMTLYAVPACPGFVPPGYDAAAGHELQLVGGGLLVVSVRIEGHNVRALLDTGARSSLLARPAAARLGVTDDALSRDPAIRGRGIGATAAPFRRHRFRDVRVGSVAVRNMALNVGDLPIPGVEMLLGADWLTGHLVWISRAAGRLFQR
jgi:predicted aspartyl protease